MRQSVTQKMQATYQKKTAGHLDTIPFLLNTMPKAHTSSNLLTESTPLSSSKEAQWKAVTKQITEVLWDIQRAARLPKMFAKPALLRTEYCKAVAMYTGSGEYVDGNSHPRFGDLGRLYYTVSLLDRTIT